MPDNPVVETVGHEPQRRVRRRNAMAAMVGSVA